MNVIESKCENEILTISISGRVDSNVAPRAEADIEKACLTPHTRVVLDAENLEYISSAGLRLVLKLRKIEPYLRVINVSTDVYDVLEMTGFTEMMTVEKAYRRLSVDGCEVIGTGANGKVYRLDGETIIKVYEDPDSLPDIQRERELARQAFILGIPTAIPYDVVKVGNGYGSVFELLNAKSFAALIAEEPQSVDKYIDLSVDLLKKIHSTTVPPDIVPSMKARVIKWVEFLRDYLPEDKSEKLISLVQTVSDDLHMMHGDYHIKNVMMQNDEVLLIDMDTLCHGHPVFELASMFNAYRGFAESNPGSEVNFLGIKHDIANYIWQRSLRLYLGTDDEKKIREVTEKAMLIGYARLFRRFIRRGLRDGYSKENEMATEIYKNHVIELIDKVSTLEF